MTWHDLTNQTYPNMLKKAKWFISPWNPWLLMEAINMLKILWQIGSFQLVFLHQMNWYIYIYVYIYIHLRLYAQKRISQRTSFKQGEYHLNDVLLTAWAQTPFQRGRLTRLNAWGLVVQWSLCSWSFSCFHCVSDLTQVFVAGATARVCWLYFTNLLTACLRLSDSCMGTVGLVSGHETAKFRTNDVTSHQTGCQARWALDTWWDLVLGSRWPSWPCCSCSVSQ